ncbi:hypothetical protein D5R81_02125 [Parashewanella spongiae]|uniref:Uncharacterized protein n=1 Tax=Parashewanella spongiae TaxID=342950 RepID=A0A3A6TSL6_9GAMM|nr:hypothetical protein [Parashewanella spongiae]MCL1076922.1 hypothetical protein [Parashewanella spongiae]RJY19172.1 hypothetical protein D5R81_02125 [Parashewanella spongiae]USN27175.1 hypothetical protein [synthetic construct]
MKSEVATNHAPELKSAVDEVLRKIGRNMLLFQQLEGLLKYIIANGQFSGYSSELKRIIEKRTSTVNKQTMGQLVGQYIEQTTSQTSNEQSDEEELKEAHFAFNFHIETDEAYAAERKESLAKLVSERNELIHHFLPKFDSTSMSSCEEVDELLEKQSKTIRREIENVKAIAKALMDGRKALAETLTSKSVAMFPLTVVEF